MQLKELQEFGRGRQKGEQEFGRGNEEVREKRAGGENSDP